MTDKPQSVSETDIVKLIQDVDDNPASFDALIEDWNSIFDMSQKSGGFTFEKVEAAARSSVASMNEAVPNTGVGRQVGYLLEQFDSPAYLVREKGQIAAQNSAALQMYNLNSQSTLDDLPLDLEQSEQITDLICASLKPGRNAYDAVLKRAHSTTDGSAITLSIAPSVAERGRESTALVFVIDARWKTKAIGLLKREFDLTTAEQELLKGFLDGQTTQAMAKSRQRSHATIRTQFHSLMGKMGATTQIELLRNALSVSQFVDQIEEITEVIRHPHRKRVDILRPGGRSVEVTMAGDFDGKPIVFFQSALTYAFESKVEQAFHNAGFCILSVCRPGYGDTDPAPDGESSNKTFAADVSSLLDQLGHDECLLMSSNMASAAMFQLSSLLSHRVSGLIQVAAAAPINYMDRSSTSVPWAQAIINAATKHPALRVFLVKSALRAWKALGQARFRNMQFRSDAKQLELVTRPEAIREAQLALDVVTKQGFDLLASDMLAIFSDFREEVLSTKLPILVVHGTSDSVFEIDAIRKFANDFSERVTLTELPDAGFSAMATHTDEIIDQIADFGRTTCVDLRGADSD